MMTRFSVLIVSMLFAVQACATAEHLDSTANEAAGLRALKASQKAAYGVPDVGDVGLTVLVSLAATKWSLLTDDQLLEWARIWNTVRAEDDRPYVGFELAGADEPGHCTNLFDISPKDGFCVAWAVTHADETVPVRVRKFMESLAR